MPSTTATARTAARLASATYPVGSHAAAQAYYESKIGIHTDQHYKGNVYQTGEYAGFDPT